MPNKIVILGLYALSLAVFYRLFSQALYPETSVVGVLSFGAIVATFGAALLAFFETIGRTCEERIKMDIDIWVFDIHNQRGNKWRRWPFLKRNEIKPLPDGSELLFTLSNPSFSYKLSNKRRIIQIPSIISDVFDLPVFSNYASLSADRSMYHSEILSLNKRKKNFMKQYFNFECRVA